MASTTDHQALNTADPQSSSAATIESSTQHHDLPASTSVEMHTLSATTEPTTSTAAPAIEPATTTTQTPPLLRSETAELALGPDGASPSAQIDTSEPVLRITLMLTTGARHPYTISSKYLASRKVTAVDANGNFDPREMSAYKLKELIWTDWRSEWEPKPRDPGAIRLIILGRMLEDKSLLKDSPFTLAATNVVHMTVKPADLLDDDAEGAGKSTAKSTRGRSNSDGESAGCCRCVIQ
ncbi:hypothetical protein MRB53_042093 [Persea americana]|nr:hypothetical protein MRB53_042093 [Persea americana]